jgi:ribosome-associated toxin RatA of RatAB toxin-antitoxin module
MVSSRTALVVAGALVLAPALALADAHPHQGVLKPYAGKPPKVKLTAGDLTALAKGEPVKKQMESKGSKGGRGLAVQDIAAPPEVVWGRILDFERYPKMVDNVKACSVYARKGEHIKTRFVIGTFAISIEYFIDHVVNQEQGWMTWTLDYTKESELHDSVGFWFVEKHPEKAGWTRLYYSVDLAVSGWVPGFVEDMLREEGLTRATSWVKREAEAAQKKAGNKGGGKAK